MAPPNTFLLISVFRSDPNSIFEKKGGGVLHFGNFLSWVAHPNIFQSDGVKLDGDYHECVLMGAFSFLPIWLLMSSVNLFCQSKRIGSKVGARWLSIVTDKLSLLKMNTVLSN